MNESSLPLKQALRIGKPEQDVPTGLTAAFIVAACLGLLTANPLLTAACFLVLPIFFKLLWKPGETPILLFAVGFQWIQVSAKVFHADLAGVPVHVLAETETVTQAIILCLIGLVVLAAGMRLGMSKLERAQSADIEREALTFSPRQLFVLYLVVSAGATVLMSLAWAFSAASQVISGAAAVKWVPFCLLGYVVLQRKQNYGYFAIALFIEFISGIGFFSGFKTVVFISVIILFTVFTRFKVKTIVIGAVAFVGLFILGLGWTSVKNQYRAFLNQGTGMQVTLVSQQQQLVGLIRLVGDLTPEDLVLAVDPLLSRIAYVDYIALSMDYVPTVLPHEGGRLWKLGIEHILKPRVLFPDKPPLIPDSDITMRYTGLHLAGAAEGTSISIGYMGESYIDFGPIGMFFPIFLLGLFWGYMYYFFRSRSHTLMTGYAFATALLINAYQFEIASAKLLGGVTSKFIVLAILIKIAEPALVAWLKQGRRGALKAKAPMKTVAG